MKLWTGKNNEIRKVMRKYSLRVGRLKRVSYGPYTLEKYVPNPNDLQEVRMTNEIKKLMYEYYKTRALEATNKIQESKVENELETQKKLLREGKKKERELSEGKKKKAIENHGST